MNTPKYHQESAPGGPVGCILTLEEMLRKVFGGVLFSSVVERWPSLDPLFLPSGVMCQLPYL